jgi:hypothetical protein
MPAIFLEDRPPRASCGDSKFSTHTSSVTRASICSKRNAREVTEVTVKNKIYRQCLVSEPLPAFSVSLRLV